MKKTFLALFLGLFISASLMAQQSLEYYVNLNDRADDQFKVTIKVKDLKSENDIYQFASTAPGTYQVMDMGRFVRNFEAFDASGGKIRTEKISENQWKIAEPAKVASIQYAIAETFDTKVDKNAIYPMCGSSLEQDHALINGQTVFGYFTGLQSTPILLKIDYPKEWICGTALGKNKAGFFEAKNYDFIVDSPILLGNLTESVTTIKGSKIFLYTYSKTNKISSDKLLGSMSQMLNAAVAFLGKLPIKKYTFLFHFEDKDAGAWEHSYSSEYVIKEQDWSDEFGKGMTDIAAHEFFHVVTPLNIHSEIISKFNFVTPTPSEHLWLYEGTTEWASHKMQLNFGIKSMADYLQMLGEKVKVDNYFDKKYSLSKLSLTSYTPEGQKQYGNIYYRGALVAGLLDIRLLELSGGKKGLREVINELAKTYGPEKSFSEKEWFANFTQSTYPEIADFFDKYVKDTQELPFAEYYDKIGITYTNEGGSPVFKETPNATTAQLALRAVWKSNR